MGKQETQDVSITDFFQTLEKLDKAMVLAEADIDENEKPSTGGDNLCVSAISKLEFALQKALCMGKHLKKKDLNAVLQFHASVLLMICQRILEGSFPPLLKRLTNHERNFEFYFKEKHPDLPLPPPEPEGCFYSDAIVSRYMSIFSNRARLSEWPWVSRKHLRLCMYMMNKVNDMLESLLHGKLPELDSVEVEKISLLPPDLSTPKALNVLEKLRNAGLLDDRYMPVKTLSQPEKAIIAQRISYEVWRANNKWKCLEDFWGIKSLPIYYHRGMNQRKSDTILDMLKEMFGPMNQSNMKSISSKD